MRGGERFSQAQIGGRAVNVIAQRLAAQDVIVLDGAFATELEARGFSVNDALWSAKALFERPDLVRDVHSTICVRGRMSLRARAIRQPSKAL